MDAFVQAVEVWVPDGGVLRLSSGAYGPNQALAELSRDQSFSAGEGLPGLVWSDGKPLAWGDLTESPFLRTEAARKVGITAGVGIPIQGPGASIAAVVVLLCGDSAGCIELWGVDNILKELRHAGAYYGPLREFGKLSKLMRFQRGRGLPGITWERRQPHIDEDTRASNSFLRASAARDSGIEAGVGFPVFKGSSVEHVVVLLSAESTPLARAFEVWEASNGGERLTLAQSFYSQGLEAFAETSRGISLAAGEGLPGKVLASGLPQVFDTLETGRFVRHAAARAAGLNVGVGIPVYDGRATTSVLVLLS